MRELRLGVIGMSPGNGHPYSWSAICNGYDLHEMEDCGFPVIPRYLERQTWPDDRLRGVRVTHIWTQERTISERVARAAHIERVVDAPEEMIGSIDALLLARDDAENHLRFVKPFFKVGMPVYIDKPIALSTGVFDEVMNLAGSATRVFSCSALRFSRELQLDASESGPVGKVLSIDAVTPKRWDTYAVHIIDPVLTMLNELGTVDSFRRSNLTPDRVALEVRWSSGVRTRFVTLGDSDQELRIHVRGSTGEATLIPSDTFAAFRGALGAFRDSVVSGIVGTPAALNRRIVHLIELGRHG